ncbi:aminotransferase [Exophiala viscosa]|uniref:Aminotransferase n=1 Tax=Exophiala viscosa TaxID=2486360 RepID=A0AAN6I931_9EURO|nr:aminotransferase [Exophiala viscosa]KAI1625450.1 aminotransferase [Exophiala viscosa]
MESGHMGGSIDTNPDLNIITTLKHILFNTEDIQQLLPPITKWQETETKLLTLHQHRLHAAASAYSWTAVCEHLERHDSIPRLRHAIVEASAQYQKPEKGMIKDVRIRILIDHDGHIRAEGTPMGEPKVLETLRNDTLLHIPLDARSSGFSPDSRYSIVSVDSLPTTPGRYTMYKTTYRAPWDRARERTGITKCAPGEREVLLFNPKHEIMEASLCTVYFYRQRQWVVPASDTGGMQSVTKTWALEAGLCVEGLIKVDELQDGEAVWLSNALRGFFPGKIRL